MAFVVDLDTTELQRALQAAHDALISPQDLMASIGETLFNAHQDRHRAGVAPDGTPWTALAASTIALGGKRKGGPLNKTGDMLRNGFNVQPATDSVTLGFDGGDGFKAKFHHKGSKPHVIRPKKGKALKFGGRFVKSVNHPGLVPRPLVGFPDSDRQETIELVKEHLLSAVGQGK